jgi:hypothetical protein
MKTSYITYIVPLASMSSRKKSAVLSKQLAKSFDISNSEQSLLGSNSDSEILWMIICYVTYMSRMRMLKDKQRF